MAGSDNGDNEQWLMPRRFKELKLIQREKKIELRELLLKECYHILPEELWDLILNIAFDKDNIVAYFEFKRKDNFYNDDHYLFCGNEKDWELAVDKMRSNVNPFDLQDDIPTDTYCSGKCELIRQIDGVYSACPDENGNKCDCHWVHNVFNSEADFNAYYYSKKRHISWKYDAGGGKLWSIYRDTQLAPSASSAQLAISHPHCPGIVKLQKNQI